MRARLTKIGVTVAALAALAVGGSALASAAQKHKASPPAPPVVQTQLGDQTTPDTATAADTDNIQQGDQSGSDQADPQGEQAGSESESAQSESAQTDGPGGYADTSPNADTQQTGEH